jgi:Domain of unknown function (DUF4145)
LDYVAPVLNLTAFHCPRCSVYAHQDWSNVEKSGYRTMLVPEPGSSNPNTIQDTHIAICEHCKEFSLWIGESMIYPLTGDAPNPSSDMPRDVKKYYEEARSIVSRSPRGAAALLRLATEKLTNDILGNKKGKNLNDNIRIMVERGLKEDVQQSADYLRVIGNNAVHPLGQIIIGDTKKDANSLFEFINIIVDDMITRPKKIKSMYDTLPEKSRSSIKKRDKKK